MCTFVNTRSRDPFLLNCINLEHVNYLQQRPKCHTCVNVFFCVCNVFAGNVRSQRLGPLYRLFIFAKSKLNYVVFNM